MDQEIVGMMNEDAMRSQQVLRKVLQVGRDDDMSTFMDCGSNDVPVARMGNLWRSVEKMRRNDNFRLRECFLHSPEAGLSLVMRISELDQRSGDFCQCFAAP